MTTEADVEDIYESYDNDKVYYTPVATMTLLLGIVRNRGSEDAFASLLPLFGVGCLLFQGTTTTNNELILAILKVYTSVLD